MDNNELFVIEKYITDYLFYMFIRFYFIYLFAYFTCLWHFISQGKFFER